MSTDGRTDNGRTECENRARILETEFVTRIIDNPVLTSFTPFHVSALQSTGCSHCEADATTKQCFAKKHFLKRIYQIIKMSTNH